MANVADAFDFYGASITVKEVSMSMWRMGISGNYPIIDSVTLDSPAAKAGLSQGNIILSVNGRAINNVSDLEKMPTDVYVVKILNGYNWESITINAATIEAEKAQRIELSKANIEVAPRYTNASAEEHAVNEAQTIFDDDYLDKHFGGATSSIYGLPGSASSATLAANQRELLVFF